MTRARLVAAIGPLALALLMSGCAAAAPAAERPALVGAGPAAVSSSLFLPRSAPTQVIIPKLDVDTRLIELGLRPDGELEVPTSASIAGWYDGAPTPGELGPAVITGHLAWLGRPGVFADLRKLDPGDQIGVRRADGSTALFEVLLVERYTKRRFPTEDVYGNIRYAGLRLITCAGDPDPGTGAYPENTVVYAGLVKSL